MRSPPCEIFKRFVWTLPIQRSKGVQFYAMSIKTLFQTALLAGTLAASLEPSAFLPPQARPESVHSKPCDGCKPPPWPTIVTIGCPANKAEASTKDVVTGRFTPPASIVWVGQGNLAFSVRFDTKTPCQRHAFNAKSPPCQIKGGLGIYTYVIRLHECPNPGAGTITVK